MQPLLESVEFKPVNLLLGEQFWKQRQTDLASPSEMMKLLEKERKFLDGLGLEVIDSKLWDKLDNLNKEQYSQLTKKKIE